MTMGKGGVGKTTIAAAVAVELAARGHEVLLTTTDPAAHLTETLAGDVPNLAAQDGVSDLHDPHIWPLSSTRTALAAHLVWQGDDPDAFLDHIADELATRHHIAHVTLQLEQSRCDKACDQAIA